MRNVRRLVSLILAMCMLAGCALAETTPTDITPPVTEAPTQAPTEAPTAAPTEAPTEAPTAAPTAAPVETATPEAAAPTEKPWDESACQHNTADCQQAPDCDIPGCAHITKDAHGLDVPACALGEWLLDAQDANPIMTLSVRSAPINLNTADATIYRSGTYRVGGGNLRPGASLTIAKNRVVVLELDNATIGTLTAQPHSQLHFRMTGQSTLSRLNVMGYNAIVFGAGGALTVSSVTTKKEITKVNGENVEIETVTFEVNGGSLQADFAEQNGRRPVSFSAVGAQSVTVNGQPYAATAHSDGKVYLWLPAPEAGMRWDATLDGSALAVAQVADLSQSAAGSVTPGQDNALQAGTYELAGAVAEGTRLTIAASGVTVVLKGATATGTLIDASSAYTLHVTGENTVETLAGSGAVSMQGDGKLTVKGQLPANVKFLSGTYVLSRTPAGYAAFAAGYALNNQKLTLDGADQALVMSESGELLLPAPAAGKTYAITANAQTVTVRTVNAGEKAFTLTDESAHVDAGNAPAFTVAGDGSFVTGSVSASGATASATFENVRLKGDGLLKLTGEHLTVTLTGDNTLQSASGSAIALDAGSTLVLNVSSGRLGLRGQNDLSGITLQGNILVEPAASQPHTALVIRDKSGNPVPNKELTVTVGEQTWQYTTHYDGSLHLWGLGDISGQDIAATDGENVYTAVVLNNQAQLTTGLTDFSDVTFASQADGSLLISWAVPGAGTTGVQLLYGAAAVDMPDAYVAGAQHITGKDFSARVTGIPAGSVVTVRVYATAAAGAAFNEQTADGFQFGKVYTYVHKAAWRYEGKDGDADATYSGKPYEPKIELPKNATITYTGADLVNGKPFYPGKYVMKVTIPEGDPTYLPGTVEISFTIKKRTITIVPGYNLMKYRGTEDPEFTWKAEGLLDGDYVTGFLKRAPGEDVGEYAWLTSGFSYAWDLYDICIDPDAVPFLIMPYGMLNIQVNEVMHPVEQTIILKDGRRLTVLLDAQESLKVTHSVLGNLVRGEDDEPRLFTPQLSWNAESDEVLLMLRAEPEMNEDHGYQTDSMGNPLWGLRKIRVIGSGLKHMDRMGITALELINKDAAIFCRVEDFLSDEMKEFIEEAGGTVDSAAFWLTVEPTGEIPEGLRPVTEGWNVRATLVIGGTDAYDITELLPSLAVLVDMEPVAELLTTMERYDEELFPEQYALSDQDGTLLEEAAFVEPFAEEELEKAAFPTMMYVSRYLAAPLTAPGTVYVVTAPAEEEAPTEAPAAE